MILESWRVCRRSWVRVLAGKDLETRKTKILSNVEHNEQNLDQFPGEVLHSDTKSQFCGCNDYNYLAPLPPSP
jgi:hypothetical protein